MYRGVVIQSITAIPATAMYFTFYEGIKYFFDHNVHKDYRPNLAVKSFIGAIFGEVAACIIANPTEIVKQKLQIRQYSRLKDCIRSIKRRRGYRGFFQGLLSLMGREVPFSCLQMPIYEVIIF